MPTISNGEHGLMTRAKLFKAKTLSNQVLASKFHYLEFETAEQFIFEPGQYVNAIVALHTFRAYSIASKVTDNIFGLLVDTRPGGPGSQKFESLKPGDELEFMGPIGVFIYRDDGSENLLLLGTGSGLSPLKCMADRWLGEFMLKKNIYLYMGLTSPEEIFWQDHFEKLAQTYTNFHFELAILKPNQTWQGHVGYNTDLMKSDFPSTNSCSAYLCGHPAMIEGAKTILLESGCAKEKIYEEKFFLQ